ncbi:MAG: M6 family metalloprotease domain-containing protein [Prevotellaceae bacterium]|nr:M6 family metalloprotease domain-containing protein [Prevotellaceae bacterium]
MKKLNILIISLFISVLCYGVPAKPTPIKVVQPDGTELIIKLNGDEHFHYYTTEDGILITQNVGNFYEYAEINENGSMFATGIIAKMPQFRTENEKNFLKTINKGFSFEKIAQKRIEKKQSIIKSTNANPSGIIGEKQLVILVNYSNKTMVTPNANQAFTNLLNQQGYSLSGAIGSIKDYFTASSDSIFQPTFDVYGPYTLPNTMSYYGSNDNYGDDKHPDEMVLHACNAAFAAGVNFSQYDTDGDGFVDNVSVFYAGYGEATGGADPNTIWPHHWIVSSKPTYNGVKVYDYVCMNELRGISGTTIDGIGTFCHEFSHILGLPDLYNTSTGYGVLNSWDIMDGGCYNGPGSDGDVPCLYSAYEMFYVGWLMPDFLNECGDYELNPLTNHSTRNSYLVAKSNSHNMNGKTPISTEFYMLENRQRIANTYDYYLPSSGLLITRVNFNSLNWKANTVNNDTKGVEIINNKTYPYLNVTGYNFVSASNSTAWNKSLSEIQKNSEFINFHFNCATTAIPVTKAENLDVFHSENFWEISAENKNYSVEIFNINGILLKSEMFYNKISINNENFLNSVYILKIKDLDNGKIYFNKVIK